MFKTGNGAGAFVGFGAAAGGGGRGGSWTAGGAGEMLVLRYCKVARFERVEALRD